MAAQIGLELKVMMDHDNMLYLIFFTHLNLKWLDQLVFLSGMTLRFACVNIVFCLVSLFQQAHACLNSLT
jgi:hypothetical protein